MTANGAGRTEMIRRGPPHVLEGYGAGGFSQELPHAVCAIERAGRNPLQQRLAVSLREKVVGMGDDAVLRVETACVIGAGLDIDD